METTEILEKMGIFDAKIVAFKNEEDGEDYSVWKVSTPEKTFVLKEAKEYELEIYKKFLSTENGFAPRFYKSTRADGKDYILIEFIKGETLTKATRERIIPALDAVISMQRDFWMKKEFASVGFTFEKSLERRKNRGIYLNDAELEKTYEEFLKYYKILPRTLCHDDLLPFNIIASNEKAALIDWEYAGMLPYPVSIARFIAHGEESDDAFFYMSDKDKEFSIQYYYDNLVKEMGIPFEEYRKVLDYFLFYEYCEWVMIGNKYGNTDSERFIKYFEIAKQKAKELA